MEDRFSTDMKAVREQAGNIWKKYFSVREKGSAKSSQQKECLECWKGTRVGRTYQTGGHVAEDAVTEVARSWIKVGVWWP